MIENLRDLIKERREWMKQYDTMKKRIEKLEDELEYWKYRAEMAEYNDV
jgi:hypothetical protein